MKKLHNITYFGADCRRQYCPPKVLRILPVTPEGELMAGSVVDKITIISDGQVIDQELTDGDSGFYNIWSSGFKHEWN